MTILYNCHTDGDNYRITKFSDGEVESSYLCSTTECQCPAGQRPSCRHRLMLPMFIARGAVNSFWFLDFERKGWVSNDMSQPCERSELGSTQNALIDEVEANTARDIAEWCKPSEPSTKPSWRRL